eukprot:218928_1
MSTSGDTPPPSDTMLLRCFRYELAQLLYLRTASQFVGNVMVFRFDYLGVDKLYEPIRNLCEKLNRISISDEISASDEILSSGEISASGELPASSQIPVSGEMSPSTQIPVSREIQTSPMSSLIHIQSLERQKVKLIQMIEQNQLGLQALRQQFSLQQQQLVQELNRSSQQQTSLTPHQKQLHISQHQQKQLILQTNFQNQISFRQNQIKKSQLHQNKLHQQIQKLRSQPATQALPVKKRRRFLTVPFSEAGRTFIKLPPFHTSSSSSDPDLSVWWARMRGSIQNERWGMTEDVVCKA